MEFFHRAKTVRLESYHSKFLHAEEDEENVKQHSNGAADGARWTVEFVEDKPNVIRLKSDRSWKYLSASDDPFLLGWKGKRAVQAPPRMKSDPSVEWEPIKEGTHVKFRSRRGTFLRANGSIPPWRNSVTHDVPARNHNQDWVLWIVDILEIDHAFAEQARKTVNDRPDLKVNEPDYEIEEEISSSSAGGTGDPPAGSFRSERSPSPPPPQQQHVGDSFSRSSSSSSNMEAPNSSYAATPAVSKHMKEISSPYIQKLKDNSSTSSFNNLNSVIADADKLLDRGKQRKNNLEEKPVNFHTSSRPLMVEVRMAKQTLIEAKDLDFDSILSSGRVKRIEKAIDVLAAHESATGRGGSGKIASLREQFQAMKADREKAVSDVEEYEAYGEKKAEVKADLQREVAKARELQEREEELCEVLEEARKRREELARELERVEEEIVEAEEKQAENEVEIREVCEVIGERNDGVKEMEREEEGWRRRKTAAERWLRQVEDQWGKIKGSIQTFEI